MEQELVTPLWSGVYAPEGQRGQRVDVVAEDGARVRVVGVGVAPQWVERKDVVPDIVFAVRGPRNAQMS